VPWRTAGISLTSIGTPIGIGVANPLLGQIAFVIEMAVGLTIAGTALFGQPGAERVRLSPPALDR
jgi:hypothetical protein